MTPNPLVLLQKLVKPHHWFRNRPKYNPCSRKKEEHRTEPIPGKYRHLPGRGWFLIAVDDTTKQHHVDLPQQVTPCNLLDRDMLLCEYQLRLHFLTVQDPEIDYGRPKSRGFFRLDDGITWVPSHNSKGKPIPGEKGYYGYRRWMIDEKSRRMRPMTHEDLRRYASVIEGVSVGGSNLYVMPRYRWVPNSGNETMSRTSPKISLDNANRQESEGYDPYKPTIDQKERRESPNGQITARTSFQTTSTLCEQFAESTKLSSSK